MENKKKKKQTQPEYNEFVSNDQLLERYRLISIHRVGQDLITLEQQFKEVEAEILRRMK